jgi:hypothetical protein
MSDIRFVFPTLLLLHAAVIFGQEQQPIQDLNQLVGKQVIIQRTPLCKPGTYTAVLDYAGKTATVISLKPSTTPRLSKAVMDKLAPAARAMMEDAQKSATILFGFEDGTRLDSCAPIGPSRLPNYLELAPGQTLQPPPQGPTVSAPSSPGTGTPTADSFSADEVKQALSGSGKNHWVLVADMGLMAAQGNQVPSITLYMPEAVLWMRAESAKKQFLHFDPAAEDVQRSLMVVAQGYAGKTITEGCTSVTRVVLLSDPSGRVVKEAYLSEPLEETWRNNLGATNLCQALRVKFSLNDVHQVKAAAPNGEFIVAVFSGSVNTKMYKVKKKHQSKLGLD